MGADVRVVAVGLLLVSAFAPGALAGAMTDSDYATLQAAAQRARDEARTAQAPEPQQDRQAAAPDQKAEQAKPEEKGLTESQIRVMLGLAWSVVPEEYQDPDGNKVKVDKGNPNRYLVPITDARRIIRAASRTAYAQICDLKDHQLSNYRAMMHAERKEHNWTTDQLMFINTLHLFAVMQMTGGVTIEDAEPDPAKPAENGAVKAAPSEKPNDAEPAAPVQARAGCPAGQKEKVQKAIDAYVASVEKAPEAPKP